MNRRGWVQGAGLLAASWLLAGCAGLGLREPIQVNLVGIDPLPGEGMEIRMAVKLRVQNPNDAALDYDGVSIALDLRGNSFATGVSAERGSVPRFGEAVISVPVSVSALAAFRQFIGIATKDKPAADYALRGRLSSPGFGGVRFESKGEIDVTPLLRLNWGRSMLGWLKKLMLWPTQEKSACSDHQRALDLLAAIDAGGVPLNAARVNHIGRSLGLEVSRHARVEDTVARIRAVMEKADE